MSVCCWGISGGILPPRGGKAIVKTKEQEGGGCDKIDHVPDKDPGLVDRFRRRVVQAQSFVKRDLWLHLPEQAGLRLLYRALRMGVLIVEGFIQSDVFMLSAALTYQVIFALVPLLVVMLAVVKGVGGFSSI